MSQSDGAKASAAESMLLCVGCGAGPEGPRQLSAVLTAVARLQAEKGDDDARPWGVDVLQAYMDKQLGKECAPGLPDSPPKMSLLLAQNAAMARE